MPERSEFVEYLLEMLAPCGPVRARAMFGGYGIYLGELAIGLVADDVFYLKADDGNRPEFEALGLGAFSYSRQGREIVMSYFEVPPDAIDDPDELCRWARQAYDAAGRSEKPKKPKRKRG